MIGLGQHPSLWQDWLEVHRGKSTDSLAPLGIVRTNELTQQGLRNLCPNKEGRVYQTLYKQTPSVKTQSSFLVDIHVDTTKAT